MIVTVSKGQQITIPSEYRKQLKLREGSKVEMIKKGNRIVIQPIEEELADLFADAMQVKAKRGLTAKQMDELIEDEILR